MWNTSGKYAKWISCIGQLFCSLWSVTVFKNTHIFKLSHRVKPHVPLNWSHLNSYWHKCHSIHCAHGLGKETVKLQQDPERKGEEVRSVFINFTVWYHLSYTGLLQFCTAVREQVLLREERRSAKGCILASRLQNTQVLWCCDAAVVVTFLTLLKRIKSRKIQKSVRYWASDREDQTNRSRSSFAERHPAKSKCFRGRQKWCACVQNYLSVETKREDGEK